MELKRFISLILFVVMLFTLSLPLVSCGNDDPPVDNSGNNGDGSGGNEECTSHVDQDGNGKCDKCGADVEVTPPGKTNYTVKVTTLGGMPLEGVMVYVHKAEGFSMAAMPKTTDANGIATFELDTFDGYSVQLDGVPNGYVVKSGDTIANRYPMTGNAANITLVSKPIEEGGFASSYKLGDIMYDFTFEDIDGNRYKLSDVLNEKKMVMLNFWYVGCSNCLYEFPYVNSAYDLFKDDIEIFAVNDYPTDSLESVKGYCANVLGEQLNMPLVKYDDEVLLGKFGSNGYPTTVIIDRYGMVSMIEIGAVLGESKWVNIFKHFTADDYNQKLIRSAEDLNPPVVPDIEFPGHDAIDSAFSKGDINVTYSPETNPKDAEYSWPFVTDTLNGVECVRPSNIGIDNSYSILYAYVTLKPGEAISFDYLSSTENGNDVLYVLVDGKDIFSISGKDDEPTWHSLCAYVDPRPLTSTNQDDEETYRLAFIYQKNDNAKVGDDTVYLKDLEIISVDDIETETYIFRYAATDLNEFGDGYDTYVDIFLGTDGYYHVGKADGPLLLVNHLGYTRFEDGKYLSQRLYETEELLIPVYDADGNVISVENKFNSWMLYGNYAANSAMYGLTPVTEQLRTYLEVYADTYAVDAGKMPHEKLWLSLCVYYDAYGKDENGNPAKQLEDPIKGLSVFSAYDAVMDDETTDVKETNTVTYDRVIMPRGLLYKFIPTVSGVYRINSSSTSEIIGWIYTGTHEEWAENGDRTLLSDFETDERVCPDLTIELPDGSLVRDNINISLAAYMEAGKEYYIDLAFYDMYEFGTFTFDIKYVGEKFAQFVQISPGPVTFLEELNGGMGQLIASTGVKYGFFEDPSLNDGMKYAYEIRGYDNDGNPILGEKIYADFYYPTIHFTSQSILDLIEASAFNFEITEADREALVIIDTIINSGKKVLFEEWKKADPELDDDGCEERWDELDLYKLAKSVIAEEQITVTTDIEAMLELVIDEGYIALRASWGSETLSTYVWKEYAMDGVLRGSFSDDSAKKAAQEEYLAQINADFEARWTEYKIDDVKKGIYHTTSRDKMTDKDRRAEEYLEYLAEFGKEALKEFWDAEYYMLTPDEDSGITGLEAISEWRYNTLYAEYQMDDVKNGIYHGDNTDYTDAILSYVEKIESSEDFPERMGCVAVTEELANILHLLFSKYVFEDTIDDWLKFCYYYNMLGYPVE